MIYPRLHILTSCVPNSPRRPQYSVERVILHQTIIQPHIDYCMTVWDYAPNVHIDKVQSQQNRAGRIVTGNYDWTIRGIDVVKQLKWETGEVYRCLNSDAPFYLASHFTRVSHINLQDVHNMML